MGIFDKAIERIATEIAKASPTATPITQGQIQQALGSTNAQGYGNSVGLPRDPQMANVPFTPGVPLIPGAINPINPATGRPDPRRYEYQVAQNINITETRLTPFKTLRAAADQIDILRRCIEVLKSKMVGLDWDIVLAEDAVEKIIAEQGSDSNVRAMQAVKDQFSDEINRARQFWEQPDVANGQVFADWLNMALEEILVLDAWAVWPQMTVGGELLGLQILDGSTIKPLIDDRGMRPLPPHPAFQQILYGFPRSEFSAPDETESADGEFSSDELSYMVRNRRTFTVYGYSPTERALAVADIYLRRQAWLRAEYTDGVLPELMFTSEANFGNSPDLLKAYENVLNDDLAGQTEQRKRARILPAGINPIQFEGYGEKFKDVLDEYLVNTICGHFGVLPTEIGFAPKGGLGGAGIQQGEATSSEVIGIVPLANWVGRMISNLSYAYLGMPRELEFKFMPSKRHDDLQSAQIADMKKKNGGLTLNEARSQDGLPLLDAPEADLPMIITPAGTFFVTKEGLVAVADPNAEAPAETPAEGAPEEKPEGDTQNGAEQALADDAAKKALTVSSESLLASKYSEAQARDNRGRFASDPLSGLAAHATDGFSVRGIDMKTPSRGYMVARVGGGIVIDAPTVESTKQGIKQFMAENQQKFQDDPTLYFGGWKDPGTGKLYLELSDNVASKKIALDLGSRRDQIGVYDVIKGRTLQTGGTGGSRAEAGTDQHPDNLYGAGTVIRKSAFGLVRLIGSGEGLGSGSVGEGTSGLDKYSTSQSRDERGRWSSGGFHDYSGNPEKFYEEVKNPQISEAESNSLYVYQDKGGMLNYMLRSGTDGVEGNTSTTVKKIDAAIDRSEGLPQDTMLYRGIKSAEGDFEFGNMKPGTVLADKAYVSTSADTAMATSFSHATQRGYMMKIQAPKGTKGIVPQHLTDNKKYAHEYEFILPRNSKFEILSVDTATKTVNVRLK